VKLLREARFWQKRPFRLIERVESGKTRRLDLVQARTRFRVRMPLESEGWHSVAFFAQADKSCLIESRKMEPITAGDYILFRI
jgi:hypothetical protein